jgi:hypothetical protein
MRCASDLLTSIACVDYVFVQEAVQATPAPSSPIQDPEVISIHGTPLEEVRIAPDFSYVFYRNHSAAEQVQPGVVQVEMRPIDLVTAVRAS